MNENWKVLKLNDNYAVSNFGNIQRIKSEHGATVGRLVKQYKDHHKYPRVVLSKNSKHTHYRVHVLVASEFIGDRPSGYDINHKNAIKEDNRPENLEYITRQDNVAHMIFMGLRGRGEKSGVNKLKQNQVDRIRSLRLKGLTQQKIADKFNISRSNISVITNGHTW